MFTEHQAFELPQNKEVKIWRYMDLPKFVYILDCNSLYFCRADKFNDEYEGSLPKPNVEARNQDPLFQRKGTASDGKVETIGETMSRFHRISRSKACINAWHMNGHESASMWQLYCSNNYGIAIQSTYSKLCKSFDGYARPIFIGVVKYIDYDREPIPSGNSFYPLLHKRKSYKHENELRAIITFEEKEKELTAMWQEPEESGIVVSCDLDILIENVYVAPNAPDWFFKIVQSISSKYMAVPIHYSKLGEEPLF